MKVYLILAGDIGVCVEVCASKEMAEKMLKEIYKDDYFYISEVEVLQ